MFIAPRSSPGRAGPKASVDDQKRLDLQEMWREIETREKNRDT